MRDKIVVMAVWILFVALLSSGCVATRTWEPREPDFQIASRCENAISGVGEVISHQIDVEHFHSVELHGHFTVIYRYGQQHAVRVEAYENLVEHVDVIVESGTLRVNSEAHFAWRDTPIVYFYAPELDAVTVSGPSSMGSWDTMITNNFSFTVHRPAIAVFGGAQLIVEHFELNSVTRTHLSGRANSATINASGGDVQADWLYVRDATINMHSMGTITITVTDTLNVYFEDDGRVRLIGDPVIMETRNRLRRGTVYRVREDASWDDDWPSFIQRGGETIFRGEYQWETFVLDDWGDLHSSTFLHN